MKFVLAVFGFLILWSSAIFAAAAAGQFTTSVNSSYIFSASGSSQVSHRISLTNNLSQSYAPSYQLILKGHPISPVLAFDSAGPLPIRLEEKSDFTAITVAFPSPVIGKNQTRTFTLVYSGPSAIPKGQIWTILLPKFDSLPTPDTYQLSLQIPPEFGPAVSLVPSADKTDANSYYFFTNEAIFAEFGTPPPPLEISWNKPLQILPLIPNSTSLTITNPSDSPIGPLPLMATSPFAKITDLPVSLPTLPPLSRTLIRFSLTPLSLAPPVQATISFSTGANPITYNVSGRLFWLWYVLITFIAAAILTTLAAVAVRTWSLHLQKRLRPTSLRRQGQKS